MSSLPDPSTTLRRNTPGHRPGFEARPLRDFPEARDPDGWVWGPFVTVDIGPSLLDLIEGLQLCWALQRSGRVRCALPLVGGDPERRRFMARVGLVHPDAHNAPTPLIPYFDDMVGPWGPRAPEHPRLLWACAVLGVPLDALNGPLLTRPNPIQGPFFGPTGGSPRAPRVLVAPGGEKELHAAAHELQDMGARIYLARDALLPPEDRPPVTPPDAALLALFGLLREADFVISSDAALTAIAATWGTPTADFSGAPCASWDVAGVALDRLRPFFASELDRCGWTDEGPPTVAESAYWVFRTPLRPSAPEATP